MSSSQAQQNSESLYDESKQEKWSVKQLYEWLDSGEIELRDVDLSGIDFPGQILRGKKFFNVNFSNAYLRECDFRKCHFEDVNFSGSDLSSANFSVSKPLVGTSVVLERVNFTGANISKATFDQVMTEGADFSYADAGGKRSQDRRTTSFLYANLSGANFSHANMHGADMGSADMTNTNLRHANFAFSSLNSVKLADADVYGTEFLSAYKLFLADDEPCLLEETIKRRNEEKKAGMVNFEHAKNAGIYMKPEDFDNYRKTLDEQEAAQEKKAVDGHIPNYGS